MRVVYLTRGCIALVDDEDYELASRYNWSAQVHKTHTYAVTSVDGVLKLMHNLLTGETGIDHVNGYGLDNQRANLRKCTQQQNCYNARPQIGKSSIYKGVSFSKKHGKWIAKIHKDGWSRHLGIFASEKDAALCYDAAARIRFGEFARLNFPNEVAVA